MHILIILTICYLIAQKFGFTSLVVKYVNPRGKPVPLVNTGKAGDSSVISTGGIPQRNILPLFVIDITCC